MLSLSRWFFAAQFFMPDFFSVMTDVPAAPEDPPREDDCAQSVRSECSLDLHLESDDEEPTEAEVEVGGSMNAEESAGITSETPPGLGKNVQERKDISIRCVLGSTQAADTASEPAGTDSESPFGQSEEGNAEASGSANVEESVRIASETLLR